MRRRTSKVSGLIAINLVLLAALMIVTWAPVSQAESTDGQTAGDFIMVAGRVNGWTPNGIYVLDQRSGVLMALRYELGGKKLKGVSLRNINDDAKRTGPGR